MGRKIDMKKIEDITRCQVTFSKRRSSVIKKANEIAVFCDVDVAFVAFSPSGRISKFCNQNRIEDVLHRYVDLPAEMRFNHISNFEQKMEKLRQLCHINGDNAKLQYLDKQIENLELQIKKSGLELQMLETDLRDYELGPEQEPSLHQLSWCDKNLNHSLQKVIHRKNALAAESSTSFEQSNEKMGQTESENQGGIPISSVFDENEQISIVENPFTGQIMMQLDPWISPYNAKVEESMFHELFGQPNYTSDDKFGLSNMPNSSIPCNFTVLNSHNIFESETTLTPHAQITSSHFPIEQSLNVDQPLLNFQQQNNIDAWNNTSSVIIFSDAAHKSSQSSCNIQSPRSTSTTTITTTASRVEMPQSLYDEMEIGFQRSNSNSISSHLSTMEKHEIGQLNMGYCQNNNIGKTRVDNVDDEDRCRIIDSNETQLRAPFYLHDIQKEVFQDTNYGNFLQEDTLEELEDIVSISEVQTSSLWEWDDLLLDGNINL